MSNEIQKDNPDFKKNFGLMMPFGLTKIEGQKTYKTIDEVMASMPEHWRHRWCKADLCACLGCCNNRVVQSGFTKKDWQEWVSRNPAPPTEEGYSFHSYIIEK